MKALEERILKDGKVLPGHVLKVGSFLNHQIDTPFMMEMGKEIAKLFADQKPDKVLTIEASGIALGMAWYQDTTVSGGTLTKNLYTKQALTADKIYDSTYNGLSGTWVERMKLYLAAQAQ